VRTALTLGLTAGAVVVVLALAASVLLCVWPVRGRLRLRAALVALAVVVVVGGAEEIVPRVVVSRDVTIGCAGTTVQLTLADTPVTWQMLTGGLRVNVHIGADQVKHLVADRLAGTRLSGASITLLSGAIQVSAQVPLASGTLPATVDFTPVVSGGQLTAVPGSVTIAGRQIPVGMLKVLASGTGGAGGAEAGSLAGKFAVCGGGGQLSGQQVTPTSVTVAPDGLTVGVRL
jgi:hypothetical protein